MTSLILPTHNAEPVNRDRRSKLDRWPNTAVTEDAIDESQLQKPRVYTRRGLRWVKTRFNHTVLSSRDSGLSLNLLTLQPDLPCIECAAKLGWRSGPEADGRHPPVVVPTYLIKQVLSWGYLPVGHR
jgi:hypothetical protein